MLSSKFGREVANYFTGNPLNRLGFLRGESAFLSSALKHPSTSFVLCRDLQPLVQKGSTRLAYASYADVKNVVGADPYAASEEDAIATYRSDRHVPQMIFLGIDEKNPTGFEYEHGKKGVYKGQPYFALDVTPRATVKEACEELIKEMEGRGLGFAQGRVMDLVASDGKW